MIDMFCRVDTWPYGLVSGTVSGLTHKQPWASSVKHSDTDARWLRVAGIDVAKGPREQGAEAWDGQRNSFRQHQCYSLSGNPRKFEVVVRIPGSDVLHEDMTVNICIQHNARLLVEQHEILATYVVGNRTKKLAVSPQE